MKLHQQIALALREKLWHLQEAEIDEKTAQQVETILRETLEGFYPYDRATGYYWITAAMNEAKDVDPAAMAPFELSVAPLEGLSLSQLRFNLRQVAPFRLVDESSSEVRDDARADDHTGRDTAHGNHAGNGNDAGAVCDNLGPHTPDARRSVRSVRVHTESAAKLPPKPKRQFDLLD